MLNQSVYHRMSPGYPKGVNRSLSLEDWTDLPSWGYIRDSKCLSDWRVARLVAAAKVGIHDIIWGCFWSVTVYQNLLHFLCREVLGSWLWKYECITLESLQIKSVSILLGLGVLELASNEVFFLLYKALVTCRVGYSIKVVILLREIAHCETQKQKHAWPHVEDTKFMVVGWLPQESFHDKRGTSLSGSCLWSDLVEWIRMFLTEKFLYGPASLSRLSVHYFQKVTGFNPRSMLFYGLRPRI